MKKLFTYKIDVGIAILLLFVSLLPRIIGLGTFLTADEKTWIGRSHEFIRAFKDVRLNDMLQTTHPGVTTLWAVGTVMTAKMWASDVLFTNDTLFHFIKSSQFAVGLGNALAIPIIYLFLFWAFRRRDVAFFAGILLSLNPHLIGYSRVIHVDALLGSFLTLAVLASILYARSFEKKWLITSAVFSALALLTKFPAVFIFPFIVCALGILHGKQVLRSIFFIHRFRDALLWVLIVLLLIFIIWPALLWVPNPVGNVLQVKRDISVAASTPHNMSEEYSLSIYHYPAALLSRSNPISLIGAILGFFALGVSFVKKKPPQEMFLIALYLVGFVVMMTLGAKKGDRYILPVFFALDILAAYGIMWFTSLLTSPRLSFVRRGVALLSAIYLLIVVISYHPYTIAYSNPLFPDNLSQELGWGEGLDQVANWLNANYPNAIVASWYPGELGPFTSARVLHINAHEQNQVQFIVLYKNMFGREPSHYANDFIDEYYKKREPVFVAHVAGKEFAWVYEKPSYPKTIGDLDAETIVVQEAVADYENLAGIRMFTATRLGEANTGTLVVSFARSLKGAPFYTEELQISELEDATWNSISFPESIAIEKGEHVFVSIRAIGSQAPYATLRYVPEAVRDTPIYISRTGDIADATEKPGSLSIQLQYIGIDGKITSELETKLLQ
ncbi:MAG: glycosyltransferase family 39 protein [bacterium]|nr:glycosyltransferase family 39 protein [bacterium]